MRNEPSCTLCLKSFRSDSHLRSHTWRNHYFCHSCNTKEKTREDILQHLKDVHNYVPPKNKEPEITSCDRCSKEIKGTLRPHLLTVHLHCSKCKLDFKSREETLEHQKTQHESELIYFFEGIHQCKFCSHKSRDNGALLDHYRRLHFYCMKCDITEANQPKIWEHFKIVHGYNHVPQSETMEKFQCNHCEEWIKGKSRLRQHKLTLHFECTFCNVNLNSKTEALQHMKEIHPLMSTSFLEATLQCDHCAQRFKEHRHLKRHLIAKHFYCKDCNEKFVSDEDARLHSKQRHGVSCDICGKAAVDNSSLKKHKDLKHPTDEINPHTHKCSICPAICETKEKLIKHEKGVHFQDKSYKCSYCEFETAWEAALKRHESRHNSDKIFPCDICGKILKSRNGVKSHKLLMHTDLKESFKCEFCSYVTHTKENLEGHIKSHDENRVKTKCSLCQKLVLHLGHHMKSIHVRKKIHQCDQCNFSGKLPSILERHKLIHNKDKPKLQCQLCDTKLANEYSLKKHIKRSHENDMPLPCELCDYMAPCKSSLTAHTRQKHFNQFQCGICEFKGGSQLSLEEHIRKHGPESEKFMCENCTYVTHSLKNLQLHNKRCKKELTKTCEICGFEYTSRYAYIRHRREKHISTLCDFCGEDFYSLHDRDPLRVVRDHMKICRNSKDQFKCETCAFAAKTAHTVRNDLFLLTSIFPRNGKIQNRKSQFTLKPQ